jgi:hypothetical protein
MYIVRIVRNVTVNPPVQLMCATKNALRKINKLVLQLTKYCFYKSIRSNTDKNGARTMPA